MAGGADFFAVIGAKISTVRHISQRRERMRRPTRPWGAEISSGPSGLESDQRSMRAAEGRSGVGRYI